MVKGFKVPMEGKAPKDFKGLKEVQVFKVLKEP